VPTIGPLKDEDPAMSARLEITREGVDPRTVELGDVTILGREPGVEVTLPGEGISRHHTKISRTDDGYLLEDLWSRNGTFVNRRRVTRKLLHDGDRIDLCDYAAVFRAGPAEEESKPTVHPTMIFEDAPVARATVTLRPLSADGTLAAANERAELERVRARLRAMYEVTDAVGITLTLAEFLEKALDKLLEIFPQADVAILMFKDPATGTMAPRASRLREGLDPAKVTVSRTVMQETATTRQAIRSTVPAEDPRFHATLTIRRHSIAALMCAPLIRREDVNGLLYIDSRRAGVAFQEDDLALLTWVGKEISLALDRFRMRRELLRRQRVERDLHLAAEVQRSFLPDAPPELPGYQFALHHKPAAGVGGDFYDFLPLEAGRLGLVIGEVAGKGIAAAVLVARVTSHIRYLSLQCTSPAQLLNRLNALLVEKAPRGSFATMIYAVLDPASRQLTLASAAHVAPLRVPHGAPPDEIVLPRQFPLGALDDTEYEDLTIGLNQGDHLVLYTDGLIDASNAQGEWYGENRLHHVLTNTPGGPQAVVDALTRDVGSFATEAGEDDDMTVVVLRAAERK